MITSTLDQLILLSTLQRISGFLSSIGSGTILFLIFRSKTQLRSVYHRLLFGLSFSDLCLSLAVVVSTAASPRSSDEFLGWGAFGTIGTCAAQGASENIGGTAGPMYNCALAVYFVARICYRATERTIQRKVEPFFHGFIIIFVLASCIFLTVTGHFNRVNVTCWISAFPLDCLSNPEVECERGENANQYKWYFVALPNFVCFSLILFCMIHLTLSVRRQQNRMNAYLGSLDSSISSGSGRSSSLRRMCSLRSQTSSPQSTSARSTNRTRNETYTQSSLYVLAYSVTYFSAFFNQVFAVYKGYYSPVLTIIHATFWPLQGFFNFLIFLRPRFNLIRISHPELSRWRVFWIAAQRFGEDNERETRRTARRTRGAQRKSSSGIGISGITSPSDKSNPSDVHREFAIETRLDDKSKRHHDVEAFNSYGSKHRDDSLAAIEEENVFVDGRSRATSEDDDQDYNELVVIDALEVSDGKCIISQSRHQDNMHLKNKKRNDGLILSNSPNGHKDFES